MLLREVIYTQEYQDKVARMILCFCDRWYVYRFPIRWVKSSFARLEATAECPICLRINLKAAKSPQ